MRKLEEKYPGELVVIGVHSAKFTAERETENIRKAVLRHGLRHPVVNDSGQKIWRRYGVRVWPTLVLIDPAGRVAWSGRGEGHYNMLVRKIDGLLGEFKGRIDRKPVRWKLETRKDSALSYPHKIVATEDRLFISDTNHDRILVTGHDGRIRKVIGSGQAGAKDGGFGEAQFRRPAGLLLDGETLYVADVENHRIRRVDLTAEKVETIAGTGEQRRTRTGGPALKTPLNSPWDLAKDGTRLFIAMAGSHSIWVLHLDRGEAEPFSGNGLERLVDGTHASASFNQPSGLTVHEGRLYVADSEASGVRAVDMDPGGRVATVVGTGLFDFGDVDGYGANALLQHALAVHAHEGKIYVADSYNHKIKVIDPVTRECRTFAGDGRPGRVDGREARFHEPSGLWAAGGKLFVADQNNHAIRAIDLKTRVVSTLGIRE